MNKEHLHPDGRPYTKEEFVDKIKTDKSFAKRFGNLGKIYGKQWRDWGGYLSNEIEKTEYKNFHGTHILPTSRRIYKNGIDQIQNLINDLKTNPDSRRLIVNAWNVVDLPVTDYRTDDELYEDYLKQNN